MGGTWPYDIEVDYNCSYQKGQVRAGDVATLTLGHLGGMAIEKIEVSVRSNKDAGAGTFEVLANGTKVSTKSGTLKNWVGTYDNENYRIVSLLNRSVSNVHDLIIRLAGTTSSLYIDRYTITYGASPARTVTLMKGDEVYDTLREEAGGQGVTLPSMASVPHWQFIGWTETPFETDYTALTSLYPSGVKYHPDYDVTLWAVYEYQIDPHIYTTELISGDYLYVNTSDNTAMTGVPLAGKMGVENANIEDPNQWYTITFNAAGDSATICQGSTYIGYSGTQLADKKSSWAVFHEGEVTAFYTTINNKTYMLFPGYDSGGGSYTQLFMVIDISHAYSALVSTEPMKEEPLYSCYPERWQATEQVGAEQHEVTVPFGIYELRIKDGHKRLKIR